MGTLFASVYNRFLDKITDDMYMELTAQDTIKDLQNLLINAIPGFEFPRNSLEYNILEKSTNTDTQGFIIKDKDGNEYEDDSHFCVDLSSEEINILAILMLKGWLQRQITSVENVRMKYSGTDFKLTSQANHLAKLQSLMSEIKKESHYLQRLYKRRRTALDGSIKSNWDVMREDSALKHCVSFKDDERDDTSTVIYDGGII